MACLLLAAVAASAAQSRLPQFSDFPAPTNWRGSAVVPQLTTQAQRLFRTQLRRAAQEPPNFATYYRFTIWGCGTECVSGALINFATGKVIAPPLATNSNAQMSFSVCQSAYEGFRVETRVDSRLLILRCGLNYDEELQRNVPDVYYFVLEGQRFRRLLHLHGQSARRALP